MADFPRLLPDLPEGCLKSLDTDSVGAWYEVNVWSGWGVGRTNRYLDIFFLLLSSHRIFLASTGTGLHCAPLPWATWQGCCLQPSGETIFESVWGPWGAELSSSEKQPQDSPRLTPTQPHSDWAVTSQQLAAFCPLPQASSATEPSKPYDQGIKVPRADTNKSRWAHLIYTPMPVNAIQRRALLPLFFKDHVEMCLKWTKAGEEWLGCEYCSGG